MKYILPSGKREAKPNRQCVLCHIPDSIFGFTMYNHQVAVCHRCACDAIEKAIKPNYPVPAPLPQATFWQWVHYGMMNASHKAMNNPDNAYSSVTAIKAWL